MLLRDVEYMEISEGHLKMNDSTSKAVKQTAPKRAYASPKLRRLGTFSDMTRTVMFSEVTGLYDAATNNYYVS